MSKIAGKNHIIRRVTLRSHPLHLSAIPEFTRIRLLIPYERDWTPLVWHCSSVKALETTETQTPA